MARVQLGRWLGKTVKIAGVISAIKYIKDLPKNKVHYHVCLQRVEKSDEQNQIGKTVASHIWISIAIDSNHHITRGTLGVCVGNVFEYTRLNGSVDYGLNPVLNFWSFPKLPSRWSAVKLSEPFTADDIIEPVTERFYRRVWSDPEMGQYYFGRDYRNIPESMFFGVEHPFPEWYFEIM